MKKYILLLFFAFSSMQAQFIVLDMTYYQTVFDTLTFEPCYSVYRLDFSPYTDIYGRGSITANPLLSSRKQPSRKDFQKNKIYDRGHLAPVLDFAWSKPSQKSVNVYTNVAPQNFDLNRGLWRELEDFIHHTYIYDYEPFAVYTGVVYGYRRLGKIRVPSHWYKLIMKDGFEKAWLIPNERPLYNSFDVYEVKPEIIKNLINSYGFREFS